MYHEVLVKQEQVKAKISRHQGLGMDINEAETLKHTEINDMIMCIFVKLTQLMSPLPNYPNERRDPSNKTGKEKETIKTDTSVI